MKGVVAEPVTVPDGEALRLHDFVPYLLSITSNQVSDRIADLYRTRFGLRIPEWRLMTVLGEQGSVTQRQLVDLTVMDKVTVNRATKTLCDRGLVARTPNRSDGRSHHLSLTADGRALYLEVVPAALDAERLMLDALSPEDIAHLIDMLARLRARAAR